MTLFATIQKRKNNPYNALDIKSRTNIQMKYKYMIEQKNGDNESNLQNGLIALGYYGEHLL